MMLYNFLSGALNMPDLLYNKPRAHNECTSEQFPAKLVQL